jgi:uncharacterized surface protein with fasciclin (FAS1) repeats
MNLDAYPPAPKGPLLNPTNPEDYVKIHTNPRRRLTYTVGALAALSLVAAACGDDADGDAAADTTTPAPATTEVMTEMSMESAVDSGIAGAPFGPACSAVPADGEGSFGGMADDPAATAASNNPLLSTLVGAVGQAGLVDTLNSEGPFTIFAPVNDAFAAIPAADLDAVLADNDLLTSILTYHVVAGQSLTAADLGVAGELDTVNGASLTIGSGGTSVNGVDVLCSDVVTANATVHIIGEVLMPPAADTTSDMSSEMSSEMSGEMSSEMSSGMTGEAMAPSGDGCAAVPADGEGSFTGMADDPAATAASNNPVLSTLVAAVGQAGLVDTLNSEGPFTIFAPTNDAFAAIPAADLEAVLADNDLLTSILTYHVVAGEKMSSADLIAAGSVDTVNGGSLTITDDGGVLTVNGVPSICMDVPTANATVHIIGGVLLPQ